MKYNSAKIPTYFKNLIKLYPNIKSGRKNFDYHHQRIVKTLKLPVVLVIANRVGCINHSVLTVKAIKDYGVHCDGLIFNRLDPTVPEDILEDNEAIVSEMTDLPIIQSLSQDMLNSIAHK